MEEGQEPKFSLVEIILILMIVIPVDILEVVVALTLAIPVIGQIGLVVMFFVNLVVLAIIQFWFIMKGVRGLWALSAQLLESIPVVNALPLRTLGVIASIYLANHPKTAQIAGATSGKIGKNVQK